MSVQIFLKKFKKRIFLFILLAIILSGCFFYFTKTGRMFSSNILKGSLGECILIQYGGNGDTLCPPGYYVPKVRTGAKPSGYMRCCK